MDQVKSQFMTLKEAEDYIGPLQVGTLAPTKIVQNSVEPKIAVTDFIINSEVVFKLATKYYYVDNNIQLLVEEVKDKENNTIEFNEKLWMFDKDSGEYIHEKYHNGERTVVNRQTEAYGLPDNILEFEGAKSTELKAQGIETQDTAIGACVWENPPFGKEPCCKFSDVVYNYCGQYCGVGQSSGGGAAVNVCDVCCYNHDTCLRGSSFSRCTCHDRLIACLGRYSCPGSTIMAIGIRAKKIIDGC